MNAIQEPMNHRVHWLLHDVQKLGWQPGSKANTDHGHQSRPGGHQTNVCDNNGRETVSRCG